MKVLANMPNFEGSVVTATEAAVADDASPAAKSLRGEVQAQYASSRPLVPPVCVFRGSYVTLAPHL
jgi:hypothetical protein